MGDIIVLAVLGVVVAVVIRSMWKHYKRGGHCYGCSAQCGGQCERCMK